MTEAAAEASDSGSVSGARTGDAVAMGAFFASLVGFAECSVSGGSHREPHQGAVPLRLFFGGAVGVVRARGGDWSGNGTQRSKSRRVWLRLGIMGAEQGWRFCGAARHDLADGV